MSKVKKIILSTISFFLCAGITYLYLWEKPKLEKYVEKYIESLSQDKSIPFQINIGKTNFSILPLQVELYETQLSAKKDLKKTLSDLKIGIIAVRPSLLDLFIGKFWISELKIKESIIKINLQQTKTTSKKQELKVDFNSILKRIPISQLNIQNIKLNINYNNQHFIKTENLYLRAYNEKSSLILSVKDPNIEYREKKSPSSIKFLLDLQAMLTKNTLSLSKLKIVKDSSYFLASGNLIYKSDPFDISEMQLKTRIKSNFADLRTWSNQVYKNNYLDTINGEVKTDINLYKSKKSKDFTTQLSSDLKQLQVGKVKIGDILVEAEAPHPKQIHIKKVEALLAGKNRVLVDKVKIKIDSQTQINAEVEIFDAQLHSFLRDSGIADIPVWLKIKGHISCNGTYEKNLSIDCPGALTASQLKVTNQKRNKNIVAVKKVDIAGNIHISEKEISYTAKASLGKAKGESQGIIDFDKGFDIQYSSNHLDFQEVGPIGELKFLGTASCKGSTKGDSDSAIFSIDIDSQNFEFEDYFFGNVKSKLNYKSGTLYFTNLQGTLESTRFNGQLDVNLLQDNIKADIRLPFFRMEDIQQAIIKKVDLKNRFSGSGSGHLQLNTPFDIDQLSFVLDAKLFKGQAFGEDYNEAKLKAEAVDGIIIVQQGLLQKEKTQFNLKGTIDTNLVSQLEFQIYNGFLQHSSNIKNFQAPLVGQFSANGKIHGKLSEPIITTKANVEDLVFNKKKYGTALFSYSNADKQTNFQFGIPGQLELLILVPEQESKNFFVNLNATKLDIAPVVSFLASEDSTRSYKIETSGELSGKINPSKPWQSEFSSTIKEVVLDYKSNRIITTIPTNLELKNNTLFLNEISLVDEKKKSQFIKVTQPYTNKYSTKLIINGRINISFFKLFAPFIEKIDGFSTIRLELSIDRNRSKIIGSSYTTNSFIKFPGFPHAFESLNADVLFTQDKVSINSLSGQLAGGQVIGNGEILLKGGKEFDLLIRADFDDVNINFPEGFKTQGRANLSLSGTKIPFLLSGNYNVSDGLIESNFSSSGSAEQGDLLEELLKKEVSSPLLLNLDIKTEKSIEIRNSLVEGYILGDFKVYDKITSPRIKGEAHFEKNSVSTSIIKFNENEFEVISSEFNFEGQSPINPKLNLRSKTRLNSYDIDLFLQGRASKPILTMTSQPPLPQTQIISMLALGQLPDQFESGNNNPNDENRPGGFEIGTSLLNNNPLGKEIKDRTGFDVQFSSSFDDQNNSAVPKITIRRKITKKFQISVSQATGSASQTEGQASYDLTNQLSAIFRVTGSGEDTITDGNDNSTRQNNPFGVDLEYKVEFD